MVLLLRFNDVVGAHVREADQDMASHESVGEFSIEGRASIAHPGMVARQADQADLKAIHSAQFSSA